MSKLTNRFCRYLKYTCENIISYNNRTHVKKYTRMSNIQPTCNGVKSVLKLCFSTPFIDTGLHTKFCSNSRKKYYPKRSAKHSIALNKFKQMYPTLKNSSSGGEFEITDTNGSNVRPSLTNSPCSSNSTSNCKEHNDRSTNNTESKKSCSESGCKELVNDDESTNKTASTESCRVSGWKEPVCNDDGSTNKPESIGICGVRPDFRVWEQVRTENVAPNEQAFKFKVLSYNVLAQYLLECHPYLYTACKPENLNWQVRAGKLYDEIIKLQPDILCLQEVQNTHLNSFEEKFGEMGYLSVYKRKTGNRHDGCAIYFKQSLFDLNDAFTVEYCQPDVQVLDRDNIAIMVKLVPKNVRGPPIVVVTTHLLYNPKRTDIRLAQMQLLLAEIDRFSYQEEGFRLGPLPVILTGDFNSTPESPIIELLDKGKLCSVPYRDSRSDFKRTGVTDKCQHVSVILNRQRGHPTDFCLTKLYNSDYYGGLPWLEDNLPISLPYRKWFNSGLLTHALNLKSVYPQRKPDGRYEATTHQDHWVTVDYIYFSECSNLRLVERLRLPTAEECEALGRLPNDEYGSDHLALAAVFELLPDPESPE